MNVVNKLIISAVALVGFAGAASAANNQYIALSYSHIDDKYHFDKSEGLVGTIGVKEGDFRYEFELSYYDRKDTYKINNDRVDNELEQTNGLFNSYFDVTLDGIPEITPFVGAGVGISYVDISSGFSYAGTSEHSSAHDTVGIGQLIAGVNFKLTDELSAVADYRRIETTEIKIDGNNAGRIKGNHYNIGLVYHY